MNVEEEKTLGEMEKNIGEKLSREKIEDLNGNKVGDLPLSAPSILRSVPAIEPMHEILGNRTWIYENPGFDINLTMKNYLAIQNIIARNLGKFLYSEFYALYDIIAKRPSAKSAVLTQDTKDQMMILIEGCGCNLIKALNNLDRIREE